MATKKPADTTKSSAATKTPAKTKVSKATTVKKSVRTKKPTTAAKTVRAKQTRSAAVAALPRATPEERAHLIAVAAYLRAESRGFACGDELEDWLCAEREVDARLASQPS
jgi:hypothetical protein